MMSAKCIITDVIVKLLVPGEDGTVTEKEISTGDKLSDLEIYTKAYRDTETIDEAEIVGFIPRPYKALRGQTRMYDGVAMSQYDPDGGAKFGTIQEVLEIRDIIVKVTSTPETEEDEEEEEEAEPVTITRIIGVDTIKSIGSESSSTGGGDSVPTGGGV